MSGRVLSGAVSAILLLLVFCVFPAGADEDQLEGYDENTEFLVQGRVERVQEKMRGPVIVRLSRKDKIYSVVTAPSWYLRDIGINLQPGTPLEVTGSKYFGRNGTVYIIAKKITELKTGREFYFRNSSHKPHWRGMRP